MTTLIDINNLPIHVADLVDVRAGKAMPFTREQMSAINKAPIKGSVAVNYMGLVSDEQADRRHHGGPLKAVHQLPSSVYSKINEQFDLKVDVGVLGENLITKATKGYAELEEATVCIGDVFQYGEDKVDGDDNAIKSIKENGVQLRIVQPRRPCFKINDQIGHFTKVPNIASWLSKQGIAGWYYEVVREGTICAELPVYLIERPYPFATLEALWALANRKGKIDREVIGPWLEIDCLEKSWKAVLFKKMKE